MLRFCYILSLIHHRMIPLWIMSCSQCWRPHQDPVRRATVSCQHEARMPQKWQFCFRPRHLPVVQNSALCFATGVFLKTLSIRSLFYHRLACTQGRQGAGSDPSSFNRQTNNHPHTHSHSYRGDLESAIPNVHVFWLERGNRGAPRGTRTETQPIPQRNMPQSESTLETFSPRGGRANQCIAVPLWKFGPITNWISIIVA